MKNHVWIRRSNLSDWRQWIGPRTHLDEPGLVAIVPASFGFSLMSAIDYRADNFGVLYFAACLVLLEWNRQAGRRSLATACGILAATACLMTQKMTFIAGGSVAAMLVFDLFARRNPNAAPFVARPLHFLASVAGVGILALASAAALGMLPPGFESTIVQAAQHEQFYTPFSFFERGYLTPFLAETWPSTLAISVFACGFLATRDGRFWIFPIAASVLAGWLMVAPFPYNFVLPCWVGVVAGVRGFALFLRWLRTRVPALEDAGPLLYLLPLAAISSQLDFVADSITNEHQLKVLDKIERYGRNEAVIDSAGGAMFNPSASYFYYHGVAHRKMFRDRFGSELVSEYRDSRALFWIWDMRFRELPKVARDYLESHYVHGGDGLYALGQWAPAADDEARTVLFEVVQPGDYYFHRAPRGPRPTRPRRAPELFVDGRPVDGDQMHLDAGIHRVEVQPHSPAYVISLADAAFFDRNPGPARHSMMFQYGEDR